MLIISQNEEVLLKFENALYINEVSRGFRDKKYGEVHDVEYFITYETNDRTEFILGKYKQKDDALKILDEIQKQYCELEMHKSCASAEMKYLYKYGSDLAEGYAQGLRELFVYKMPKDKEVS